MITENSIRAVKQFVKPGIESGLIPRDQFEEMVKAARSRDGKPEKPQLEMLTVKKVAEIFNCSSRTVFRMRDSGSLKGVYLTDSRKSLRFAKSEIERVIERSEVEAQA